MKKTSTNLTFISWRNLVLAGWTSFLAISALPLQLNAQSDNFDSGSLSGAWTKYQFFGQSYTFPAVGNGKGLRIQANPAPGSAPAAAGISQTNDYTDFYVAVDIVNWA